MCGPGHVPSLSLSLPPIKCQDCARQWTDTQPLPALTPGMVGGGGSLPDVQGERPKKTRHQELHPRFISLAESLLIPV